MLKVKRGWLGVLALGIWSAFGAAQSKSFQIAYNVCVDVKADNYDVFLMDLDGSNVRQLTHWKGVDWVYAAYQDRLFVISDRGAQHRKYHLYEINVSTGKMRQITSFLLEDSWLNTRRSGSELVVSSSKDGADHELYIINRQGDVLERLTENEDYENDPHFSPDGKFLVYRSKASGVDELWLKNLVNGERQQLTHFPKEPGAKKRYGYHAGPPFWVPNQQKISFTSMRSGKHSLYTIKPDGSELNLLVDMPGEQVYHSWSSDGRFLGFDSTDQAGHFNVYLMDAKTKKIKQLTNGERIEQAPVFVELTAKP